VVIGTAASRAAVDPAALEAGMLELEVVIDPPHVSDRPHILASVLKQRQVELLQDPANDEGNDSAASAAGDAAVSPGGMDVAAVRFAEGLIGYVPGDIVSLVDKASELASLEQQAAVARAAAARLASVEQQQLEEGEEAAAVTRGDASYGEDRLRNGMTQGEYDRAWAALADTPAKPDPTESEHSTPAGSSRVQLRHLHAAKALVAGSALQGLQTDVQKASWEDVGGLESVKADLVRAVQWPLLHRRVFDRFHVSPPRGILLFGPPGCSKTLLVRALASTSGASFFSLSGADVYSKYVGQAERNLSEAFRRARAARPAVIFLDEVEALVGSRAGAESASETDGGASSGVLATLLTEMDGTETVEGVVVVAATNRPAALDAALLRPGRFGLRLAVGPPDADGRLAILKVHTRLMTLGADVDLQALAARCSRFTGAELEALCRYADTEAQRECLVRAGTPSGHAAAGAPSAAVPSETTVVTAAHFEAAMGQLSTLFGGPGGEIRLEEAMQAMRKFASGASATGAAAMLGRASAAPAFGVAETDPAAAFRAAAAGGTA
jgi:SpoVK/Ycf46/Vps4 family AAA+-type ATPase